MRTVAGTMRSERDQLSAARRAVQSIHIAELQLLHAGQRAERRQAVHAVEVLLRSQHQSRIAAITARFADRRSALAGIADPQARAAAARRLDAEQAAEIASLALQHGAEVRRERQSTLGALGLAHKAARRSLRQRQRHQRAGLAVQLRGLRPRWRQRDSGAGNGALPRAAHRPGSGPLTEAELIVPPTFHLDFDCHGCQLRRFPGPFVFR